MRHEVCVAMTHLLLGYLFLRFVGMRAAPCSQTRLIRSPTDIFRMSSRSAAIFGFKGATRNEIR